MKIITHKIALLKEQGAGTYQGVELNLATATAPELREESQLLGEERKPTRAEVTEQIAASLIEDDKMETTESIDKILCQETTESAPKLPH